jgi:hypothetical protein
VLQILKQRTKQTDGSSSGNAKLKEIEIPETEAVLNTVSAALDRAKKLKQRLASEQRYREEVDCCGCGC